MVLFHDLRSARFNRVETAGTFHLRRHHSPQSCASSSNINHHPSSPGVFQEFLNQRIPSHGRYMLAKIQHPPVQDAGLHRSQEFFRRLTHRAIISPHVCMTKFLRNDAVPRAFVIGEQEFSTGSHITGPTLDAVRHPNLLLPSPAEILRGRRNRAPAAPACRRLPNSLLPPPWCPPNFRPR